MRAVRFDVEVPALTSEALLHSSQDWHVDMAASSVYYHVVRGEKVFYFSASLLSDAGAHRPRRPSELTRCCPPPPPVRPTAKHLEAYKTWASTEKQTMEWLGHSADEVYKVVVRPGATAFIPAGWIHAVVRPAASPCAASPLALTSAVPLLRPLQYTPKDSLVYGGNFVHTLAIPMRQSLPPSSLSHRFVFG